VTLSPLATATADLMDALDALAARPHAPPLLEMRWMRDPDGQGAMVTGATLLLTGKGPGFPEKANWPEESAHQRLADTPHLRRAQRAMEAWVEAWKAHPFLRTLLHPYGQAHRWAGNMLTRHAAPQGTQWACSVAAWNSSGVLRDRDVLLAALDAMARASGPALRHAVFLPEGRNALQADLPHAAMRALCPLLGVATPEKGHAHGTWEGVWRHAGHARLTGQTIRFPPPAHQHAVRALLQPVLDAAYAMEEPPGPHVVPMRHVGAELVHPDRDAAVHVWIGKAEGKRQDGMMWALARQPHRMAKMARLAQAWKDAAAALHAACPTLAPPTDEHSWQIKIAFDRLAAHPVSVFVSGTRGTTDLFAHAYGRPAAPRPLLITPDTTSSYAAMVFASPPEAADLYALWNPETARQGIDLWRRPMDLDA